MCRLYGFRANELTKVECGLVQAQNSLLAQSRSDARGTTHADGWGIATYRDGVPSVDRRAAAAFESSHFSTTAERVFAQTVVAHVRNATVGDQTPSNAHPFVFGCWVFAHNGTVRAFDRVAGRMEAETAPRLRPLRQGSTDSEVTFYWLLTRMDRAGIDIEARCDRPATLTEVFAGALPAVESLCAEAGADVPSRLNWILTDGDLLLASRWNNDLHWLHRHGVHDCEICGIAHVDHRENAEYRALVIASEPISHEEWREVPEASFVVVDSEVEPTTRSL